MRDQNALPHGRATAPAVASHQNSNTPRATTTDVPLTRTSSTRSEEHTSELQSRSDLVCRLLLEKKKKRYDLPIKTEEHTDELQSRSEPSYRLRFDTTEVTTFGHIGRIEKLTSQERKSYGSSTT